MCYCPNLSPLEVPDTAIQSAIAITTEAQGNRTVAIEIVFLHLASFLLGVLPSYGRGTQEVKNV